MIRTTKFRGALLLCAVVGSGEIAAAPPAEPVALTASRDYLVGASLGSSADHIGREGQRLGLSPMWAFQWGRWRFATSGASALLSLGRETVDAGVSTALVGGEHWSLSASLQYDEGRSASDGPRLRGTPDVRATLRGRLRAGYAFDERWSWNMSASQDLLGRDGGLSWSHQLRYRREAAPGTYWDVYLGGQWGNGMYRQTRYGVAPQTALASGHPVHTLGSGWESVQLGWGMASAVSRRWVAFGGVGVSHLLGGAGRSPLVSRRTTYAAHVGLAYRCCF